MSSKIFTDYPAVPAQDFSPFPSMPPELREAVWKEALKEPGIHFARLGRESSNLHWILRSPPGVTSPLFVPVAPCNPNVEDGEAIQEDAPRKINVLELTPPEGDPRADISQYRVLWDEIDRISAVCREAEACATKMFRTLPTLNFGNGDPVSLPNDADDVLFIDYLPPILYQLGCSLFVDPYISKLDNVRQVAVRYCHQWNKTPRPGQCRFCLEHHQGGPEDKQYPMHLVQFLTRTFKNLERVWLVDYLLRPADNATVSYVEGHDGPVEPIRDPNAPRPANKRFVCKNRVYHEAKHDKWDIKPEACDLMNWLNAKFISYGEKSKYSRQKDPVEVEFGLLACEWTYPTPVHRSKARSRRSRTKLTASYKRFLKARKARDYRRRILQQKAETMHDAHLSANSPR